MIAVKDSFDGVPIAIEEEGDVVPGVMVRAKPGSSAVDPSCLDGCGVAPDTAGLRRSFVERATPCDVANRHRHMIDSVVAEEVFD